MHIVFILFYLLLNYLSYIWLNYLIKISILFITLREVSVINNNPSDQLFILKPLLLLTSVYMKKYLDNWRFIEFLTFYSMLLVKSYKSPTTKMSFSSAKIVILFLFDTFNLKYEIKLSSVPSFLYSWGSISDIL